MSEMLSRRSDWKPEYTTKALNLIAQDDRAAAITTAVVGVLSSVGDDEDRDAGRGRIAWTQALAVHAPEVVVPAKPDVDLGEAGDRILRRLQERVEKAVREAHTELETAVSVPGQEG